MRRSGEAVKAVKAVKAVAVVAPQAKKSMVQPPNRQVAQ
jgi:hypothetical protein